MAKQAPIRALLTGFPGAGKTGSLACLANAGFKLRILDFDGNPESLLKYTKRAALKNIDIMSFEDPQAFTGSFVGTKGAPSAFIKCCKALDSWKYTDPDGTEVDLGASSTWGGDTIVVLDGLTGLSQACFARAQAMMNKTPLNTTQAVWGLAIQDQANFIRRLTAASNLHHVIAISHLKMIGPKAIEGGDNQANAELKERMIDLVPTRYYPTALGQQLPQTICGEFPIVLNINSQVKGGKVKRTIRFQPVEEMDLKLPVPLKALDSLTDLGVDDGILRVFDAMGIPRPG